LNERLRLYSYWRSSAAYRVRIGLNLKGLRYETVPVHLVRDGGEQHGAEFRAINPQGLVPVLQHGNRTLRQSLAILEYLDETWPAPMLLPSPARDRQRVRALAQLVACDIHPLNNLRVLQFFERTWNVHRRPSATTGCGTGSSRASRRWRRCWPTTRPPAPSARANCPRWPTAAWCRSSTTRAASG
jgi:maleylacetoacetate isomerase